MRRSPLRHRSAISAPAEAGQTTSLVRPLWSAKQAWTSGASTYAESWARVPWLSSTRYGGATMAASLLPRECTPWRQNSSRAWRRSTSCSGASATAASSALRPFSAATTARGFAWSSAIAAALATSWRAVGPSTSPVRWTSPCSCWREWTICIACGSFTGTLSQPTCYCCRAQRSSRSLILAALAGLAVATPRGARCSRTAARSSTPPRSSGLAGSGTSAWTFGHQGFPPSSC
mmetsp:Transcript_125435/g.349065  ORF Transcript_125435/g.349065 Transcript_125435/m.349065 type:complete len:233 (-) Transcript_125435:731-1429(-)